MTGDFRSVLVLRAKPGTREEIARLYRELDVFEKAAELPGFREAELLVSANDPDELIVLAAWDSSEAYDGWLTSPVRAELSAQLEHLFAADPGVGRFDLAVKHGGS